MEPSLFDEAGGILRTLVPVDLGDLRLKVHRYGMKAWFDTDVPPRDHYEAQVVGPRDVPAARVLALEIGFHAEHKAESENQAIIDALLAREPSWRKVLGAEAECEAFLGRKTWRRVSEAWLDLDLSDPELPFEVAARLTDYITALEPVRRS